MNPAHAPLTPDECFDRLSRRSVGSVALSRGALPVIEPVVYGVFGRIVALEASGSSALADSVGEVIALGVHQLDADDRDRWSVNAIGIVGEFPVDDERVERWRAVASIFDHGSVVLALSVEHIFGSRLGS